MSQINRPTLCRLSELTPLCIDWIWPSYLAAGKLTLIDGDPSQGKSLLALDLAARLTTGREWPDGQNASAPQPVMLFAGEDGIQDTVQPRLRAAGADLSFIHILGTLSALGGSGCTPRLPDDCDLGPIPKCQRPLTWSRRRQNGQRLGSSRLSFPSGSTAAESG